MLNKLEYFQNETLFKIYNPSVKKSEDVFAILRIFAGITTLHVHR